MLPGHTKPNTGERCPCGVHHYRCETCGVDCTAGQPAGPCTQAIDRKHRCDACNRAWQRFLASAAPTTEDEVKCVREALKLLRASIAVHPHLRQPYHAALDRMIAARQDDCEPSALAKGGSIDN